MHINDLPAEMLYKIFSCLPTKSLVDSLMVCERWQEVINGLHSWKHHPVTFNARAINQDFDILMAMHSDKIENIIFRLAEYEQIHSILLRLPFVTQIQMIMCSVEETMPSDLLRYPDLELLKIKSCYVSGKRTNHQANDLNFFNMPKLHTLLLSDFGLSNNNFDGLLACAYLTEVYIEKIRDISEDNIVMLLEERRDRLTALEMYGYDYTDRVAEHISQCKKITKLKILRCEMLTDRSLICFRDLRLIHLTLWNNSSFSHAALVALFEQENLRGLQILSFSKVFKLKMSLFSVIAKNCEQLVKLGIYRCPCMESDIHYPTIITMFSKARVFFE